MALSIGISGLQLERKSEHADCESAATRCDSGIAVQAGEKFVCNGFQLHFEKTWVTLVGDESRLNLIDLRRAFN